MGQTVGLIDTSTDFILYPISVEQFLIPEGLNATHKYHLNKFILQKAQDYDPPAIKGEMISLELSFRNQAGDALDVIIDGKDLVKVIARLRRDRPGTKVVSLLRSSGKDEWRFGLTFLKMVYVEMNFFAWVKGGRHPQLRLYKKQ